MIDLATLGGGALLGAATAVLAERLFGTSEHILPRTHNGRGVSDLLLWAGLHQQRAVLQKDGTVLVAAEYAGPDPTRATPDELAALTNAFVDAFRLLTPDHALQLDHLRAPAPAATARGTWQHPLAEQVARESANLLSHAPRFQNRQRVAITWKLPKPQQQRILRLLLTDSEERTADALTQALEDLEAVARDAFSRLGTEFKVRRLEGAELLGYLAECYSGEEALVAPTDELLDQVLANADFVGGYAPRVGDQEIAVATLFGYPDVTRAGILDALADLPFGYRINYRFQPLSASTASLRARAVMRLLNRTRQGVLGGLTRDQDARRDELMEAQGPVHLLRDARDAEALMRTGHRFGYLTPTVVLRAPTRELLAEQFGHVATIYRDGGFVLRRETANAARAFLGSLPGHGLNQRKALVSLHSVALLTPLTAPWHGPLLTENPNLAGQPPLFEAATTTRSPFRVDLFNADVGHTLVFGPTGAGKSTLLLHLLFSFLRYPSAQIFLFDVGYSAAVATLALRGAHYDIGGQAALPLMPLRHLDTDPDLAAAHGWLTRLLQLAGGTVEFEQSARITSALTRLSATAPSERTLEEFAGFLQDSTLKRALAAFLPRGAHANLFSATEDHLDTSQAVVTLEVGSLLRLPEGAQIPALDYLFRRIEARLSGRPTLVFIDEAWRALLHPLFAERIAEWLRTFRKANASVILATQSLAEVLDRPASQALLDAAPSRILLPNPEAELPNNAALYAALGLNSAEIATLATARKRRDYLLQKPSGSKCFQLPLGPLALALYTPGDGRTPHDAYQQALAASSQPNWLNSWLRTRGVQTEVL